MDDDQKHPEIKITDRRHFDISGSRRPDPEIGTEHAAPEPPARPKGAATTKGSEQPSEPKRPADTRGGVAMGSEAPSGDLSGIAQGLSSSFSLLVARLAQETEIYLGLVPYPGKETAEPDLDAARAMIDMLSMLQEKTRGNLDPEESHLLDNLLYSYRLEFVRRRSGGEGR